MRRVYNQIHELPVYDEGHFRSMSQQTFAEMSETEFDTLIDSYIEREAASYGEMPAEIFFVRSVIEGDVSCK